MIRPYQHLRYRGAKAQKKTAIQTSTPSALQQASTSGASVIRRQAHTGAMLGPRSKSFVDGLAGHGAHVVREEDRGHVAKTQPVPVPAPKASGYRTPPRHSIPSNAIFYTQQQPASRHAGALPVYVPWTSEERTEAHTWFYTHLLQDVQNQLGFVLGKGQAHFFESDCYMLRTSLHRSLDMYDMFAATMTIAERGQMFCNLMDTCRRLPEYREFDALLVVYSLGRLREQAAGFAVELATFLETQPEIKKPDVYMSIVQRLLASYAGGGVDPQTHYLLVGCKAILSRQKKMHLSIRL